MTSRFTLWTFVDHVLTAWSKRFITWDGYFSAAVDHYEDRFRAPFPHPQSPDDEPVSKGDSVASELLRDASNMVWSFAHRIADTRPPLRNPAKTTTKTNMQRTWMREMDGPMVGGESRWRAGYEVLSPSCWSATIKTDWKMEHMFTPSPRGSDFSICAWR